MQRGRMNAASHPQPLIAALALAGVSLAAPPAGACTDRPGTPVHIGAEPLSPTAIRFKFRITTRNTELNRFYDLQVEEVTPPEPGQQLPTRVKVRDLPGIRANGPAHLGFGGIDHFDIPGLKPGKEHCVRVRARTEAGTQGCVSALWSGQACTKTLPELEPRRPPRRLGKVATLVVVREGGTVFRITGHNFRPDAAVVIQVSGPATSPSEVKNAPGRNLIADAKGQIAVSLTGLCERDGAISFTADDGLRSTRRAVQSSCRLAIFKLPKGPVTRP
jgi:hypothetical protein